jgi:hypothetical protein
MPRFGIVAAANRARRYGLPQGRASRWTIRTRLLIVAFLGALIGSAGAWFAFPAIARASSTCGDFSTYHYNVGANETSGTHYGEGVTNPGIYIFDHPVGCAEVSSIEVFNISGDEAEIGWIKVAGGVFLCNATGDGSTIRVLTTWRTAGTTHCAQHGTLTPNQSDSFHVWGDSGSSGSYPWTWDHDGAHPQVATLDFRLGTDLTNGERYSTYDSAQSQFDGLQIGHGTGTWNPWAGATCAHSANDDPTYFDKILSSTHVNVSTAGTPCP